MHPEGPRTHQGDQSDKFRTHRTLPSVASKVLGLSHSPPHPTYAKSLKSEIECIQKKKNINGLKQ